MAPDPKRRKAYQRGINAEKLVFNHLASLGFEALEQRYKTQYGEIDLILQRDNLIIFVEVKARASIEEALIAITPKSQKRIISCAEAWISAVSSIADDVIFRFDVAAVTPDESVMLYEGAFDASS